MKTIRQIREENSNIEISEIKRVHVDPMKRREAAAYYRKNKLSIKSKQTNYRRSAAGDRKKMASKVMASIGRTSTGAKHKKIFNKPLGRR